MKYVAILDTDKYKDFKFFEDGNGEYLVVKDENAKGDEWIPLLFTRVSDIEEVGELRAYSKGYGQAVSEICDCITRNDSLVDLTSMMLNNKRTLEDMSKDFKDNEGYWIKCKGTPMYRCSACNTKDYRTTKHCPECGMKMRGVRDESNS